MNVQECAGRLFLTIISDLYWLC